MESANWRELNVLKLYTPYTQVVLAHRLHLKQPVRQSITPDLPMGVNLGGVGLVSM